MAEVKSPAEVHEDELFRRGNPAANRGFVRPENPHDHTRSIRGVVALPEIEGEEAEITVTGEQEAFCREYVKSGNVSGAIKKALPGRQVNIAHYWIRQPHVRERIREMQAELRKSSMLTLEDHLRELADLRDKACDAGKYAAAITAEVARGKAAGLYVERIETHSTGEKELSRDALSKRLVEVQKHLKRVQDLEDNGDDEEGMVLIESR